MSLERFDEIVRMVREMMAHEEAHRLLMRIRADWRRKHGIA